MISTLPLWINFLLFPIIEGNDWEKFVLRKGLLKTGLLTKSNMNYENVVECGQSNINSALGSIPNDLECNLKKLGISYNVGTLQKSVLLGTANILREALFIKQ